MQKLLASLLAIFLSTICCAQQAPAIQVLQPRWEAACLVGKLQLVPLADAHVGPKPAAALPVWQLAKANDSKLIFREMSNSPRSSSLGIVQVRNKSKTPLWLPAGTMLKGGWQNRIITQTLLLPAADTPVYASTLCIEKNRWQGRKSGFAGWLPADAKLTLQLARNPHQQALWRCIDDCLDSAKSSNPTADYLSMKQSMDTAGQSQLKDCLAGWEPKSFRGVLVLRNANWLIGETVAQPAMLQGLLHQRILFYQQLPEPRQKLQGQQWPPPLPSLQMGLGSAHAMFWF